MKRDYFLLLLLLCLISGSAQAQGTWKMRPIDFYITTGPALFHNKSYNQFYKSFNTFQGTIPQPLSGFGLSNATTWGLSLNPDNGTEWEPGGGFDFAIFGSRLHGQDRTTYDGDEHRVFDMTRRQVGFEVGGGRGTKHWRWSWGVGGTTGHTVLRAYYVYADGTKSFGKEKIWNGVYDQWNFSAFLYSKFVYDLKYVKLVARFALSGDILGKDFFFEDRNYARSSDQNSLVYPDLLPTDVPSWDYSVNGPNIDYYHGNYVDNRLSNLSLQFGMSFPLYWPGKQ